MNTARNSNSSTAKIKHKRVSKGWKCGSALKHKACTQERETWHLRRKKKKKKNQSYLRATRWCYLFKNSVTSSRLFTTNRVSKMDSFLITVLHGILPASLLFTWKITICTMAFAQLQNEHHSRQFLEEQHS